METLQNPEAREVPATEAVSKNHLFTYVLLFLLVILPIGAFWLGNQYGSNQAATREIVEEKNEETITVSDQLTVTTASETDLSVEGSPDGILPLNTDELIHVAINSYVHQKLATVAVFDTPTPYVKIAVAANREASVYCGYDGGPCYLFLQAYHADYPRVKYLGSIDSIGAFDFSTVKFISPTVFQVISQFGDAGVGITKVVNFDITTGSSTVVSEEKTTIEP